MNRFTCGNVNAKKYLVLKKCPVHGPKENCMMDQFVVSYIPGGMSLYHSGMWLCQRIMNPLNGIAYDAPIRMLEKSEYK